MSEYILLFLSALVSASVNTWGRFRGSPAPERILVVKLDHLGDVVLATPAVRALRLARPDVTIDVLAAPDTLAVFEGNPGVRRLLSYDSKRYRRAFDNPAVPRPFDVMREVARARYTTIVELRGDAWTLLLPFLSGSRRRLDRGSVRTRDWLRRRRPGAPARPPLHEVDTNLEIVRPLLQGRGAAAQPELELFPHPASRSSLHRKLELARVDLGKAIVLIHPAASWGPRAWRPARFAAVADWIQEHYDAQVLFLGSAKEREVQAEVQAHARAKRAFWLAGSLTLWEVAALFPSARLLIDNDTGLAHLAAASGTPSIVLFGAQVPERFRPWSDRSVILHHRVTCCPCAQVTCVRPENPCVNEIGVAEVQARIVEILGSARAPNAVRSAS